MNVAISRLLVLGIYLGSAAALFGQTGPALEPSLPVPRHLPAGAPVPAPAFRPPAMAAPVEEPAPPPREVANPFDLLPSIPPGEESAPMPREQNPPPPRLVLPSAARAALPLEMQRLHHEIEGLRRDCEAMVLEEIDLKSTEELKSGKDDVVQLRRRITEMLLRAAQQSKRPAPSEPKAKPEEPRTSASASKPPAPSPPTPLPPPGGEGSKQSPRKEKGANKTLPSPLAGKKGAAEEGKHPSKQPDNSSKVLTDAPVDPLSLAQSLYLAGDHEAALNAYRQLEKEEQKPDERVAIQYMIACCLRKLSKLDEATLLYREVANSGGSDILVENAQWYLRAIKDRRELEGQLDELRQRRQAIMPRKP